MTTPPLRFQDPRKKTDRTEPEPRVLPWWTWFFPLALCLGAQLPFQSESFLWMFFLPTAVGRALIHWWGLRVLPGAYLGFTLGRLLWGLSPWPVAPLLAVPPTLGIFLSWWLFGRLHRGRCWLPDAGELWAFALLGVGLPVVVATGLHGALLAFVSGIPAPQAAGTAARLAASSALLGVVVTVPLLIVLTPWLERRGLSLTAGATPVALVPPRLRRRRALVEVGLLLLAATLLGLPHPPSHSWMLADLCALWAALRYGVAAAALLNAWVVASGVATPLLLSAPGPGNWWSTDTLAHLVGHAVLCFAALAVGRAMQDAWEELGRRREAEETYRSVVESLGVGVAVIDPALRVQAMNRQMRAWFPAAHPAERPPCYQVFNDPAGEEACADCPARRAFADGGVHEAVREAPAGNRTLHYRIVASPIKGADGTVTAVAELVENVTERRRAEGRLRRSEERFRELFDNTSDGLFLVDVLPHGVFHVGQLNPAAERMLGLSPGQIEGRRPEEFFPKNVAEAFTANYRRCLETESSLSFEEHLDLPNGSGCFFTTLSPVRNAEGRICRIAGIARDMTAQRRLERERELLQARLAHGQKLEAIGTLAGGIAHDFNNILGAVLGYTDMALAELPPEDSLLRQYLSRSFQAATRATSLVKQIVTFSRQTRQERGPLPLRPIVKESLKLLRATLPATIEIREQILAEGLILGDPGEIHQVLLNLGTNAGLAMAQGGGVLAVTLEEVDLDSRFPEVAPGRYAALTVSDTGCGIPPETLDRLFDPFFTTRSGAEGTGLGLSVVHGIIRAAGGTVTVESAVGRGTTFRVLLPLVPTEDVAEEEALPLPGDEHLLFVDDEEMLVDVAARGLRALGYRVSAFTSSRQALDALRAAPGAFDAVVSDLTMPEIAGEELAREVRALCPHIPVLLVTGYSERPSPEWVSAWGADGILDKPLLIPELALALRRLFASKASAAGEPVH